MASPHSLFICLFVCLLFHFVYLFVFRCREGQVCCYNSLTRGSSPCTTLQSVLYRIIATNQITSFVVGVEFGARLITIDQKQIKLQVWVTYSIRLHTPQSRALIFSYISLAVPMNAYNAAYLNDSATNSDSQTSSTLAAVLAEVSMNINPCCLANSSPYQSV